MSEVLVLLIPLAAICFPIAGLTVILGFVLILRYLRIKETAVMLERGVPPEMIAQPRPGGSSRALLFTGILLSMIGLALSAILYPIGFVTGLGFPLGLGPGMIAGLLPLFLGVGFILWHYLTQSKQDENTAARREP